MKNSETTLSLNTLTPFSENACIVYAMCPGLNGRKGIPVCIWGKPGGAKSTMIRGGLQRLLGMHVETVTLSTREPQEVSGSQIPNRLEDGEIVLEGTKTGWVRRVIDKVKQGIPCAIFFDELTTCLPMVQAPALRIVNEGKTDAWVLPPEVRFFCAANPPDCSAGGQDLTAPMANRMGHFDAVEITGKAFSDWLQTNGGRKHHLNYENTADEQFDGLSNYKTLEKKIEKRWDLEFSKACALVGSFMEKNPSALLRMPEVDSTYVGRAWPSARTWEAAARLLATARCLDMDDKTVVSVISSIVGTEVTSEFISYSKHLNLPDLVEILEGTSNYRSSPQQSDISNVVLQSLGGLAIAMKRSETLTRKQLMNYWAFMNSKETQQCKDILVRVLSRVIDKENTLVDSSIPDCVLSLDTLSTITAARTRATRK